MTPTKAYIKIGDRVYDTPPWGYLEHRGCFYEAGSLYVTHSQLDNQIKVEELRVVRYVVQPVRASLNMGHKLSWSPADGCFITQDGSTRVKGYYWPVAFVSDKQTIGLNFQLFQHRVINP